MTTVVTNRGKAKAAHVLHVIEGHTTVQPAVVGAHGTAVPCRLVAIRKPHLHVGRGRVAGGDVEGNTAKVELWLNRGAA